LLNWKEFNILNKNMEVDLAKVENIKEISKIFEKLNTENLIYTNFEDINTYIQEKRCYIVKKNSKIVASCVYKIYE
jgi:transcription initiation factor TFIIIB Brf1 subunit/transcription initiation factor TFIIB